MKYASIDVGTNAVLLLIAQSCNGISDILDISTITRLGENLKEKGCLSDEAMTRTFYALEKYRKIVDKNDVCEILCVGTSALREAENAEVFLKMVREKLKFTIRVISEHDEAHYTYLSVKNDELIKDENVIVVDIGGGSTEIIKGNSQEFFNFISLRAGAGKLTEMFVKHDPPPDDELSLLAAYVKDLLLKLPFDGCGCSLIGTGGTITTMAGILRGLEVFDKDKIHAFRITLEKIDTLIDLMKSMDSSNRSAIVGMEKGREDILLQGIIFLREIMVYFGFNNLIVSTKGVRYGIIYEKIRDAQT
ncbi:MAG: Ppx/GppA phosphatase family protein [Proteobacteria bacterium]|nr:Ppx/GppA phosphatase family protein [Pseudomonadota bacterium]